MDTQVLIVGAGPVGLTLAVDLGMQGIKCILLEKKDAPEFLPKMERCNARTMEMFRRIGLSQQIRDAGLDGDVPMDVFVVTKMTEAPLLTLKYPSVNEALAEVSESETSEHPAEAYQLISQYTLEPLLKSVADKLPSVDVRYGTEFVDFTQDAHGVTVQLRDHNGQDFSLRAPFMVGCDGGSSLVRKGLDISLRGEGNILRLRQALYRSDDLFDRIPLGAGPGQGRHYHVADDKSSFLIMQDSTKHWTLHAVVDSDAEMAQQFEKVVGTEVDYEMLYVGEWKQNLLLADRYAGGRVFLAGDSAHLVIPTGGLGMNTGVGDAFDLSWKLAATLQGWAGPNILRSYETERRQVGDRNVGASRYASQGRRRWRAQWAPGFNDDTPSGRELRTNLARVADVEQRKTNEMIGAELGYRYVDSPVIWDEPGGPEHAFRVYDPTAWTGVRLPHVWLAPGKSINDTLGRSFTIIRFASNPDPADELVDELRARGAPVAVCDLPDPRLRAIYGRDYFLVRPDLHIAWRGNAMPKDLGKLADVVTGRVVADMGRHHAQG
ncbi:FAD-dependent monooxygenase [Roseicitreum antarcticum]|uniref:2-polyprenyl-6-methoxyphenol hydroxylase n=1 Tax=Roseicitreum antarcticum TaxID=564137 RepID=A0A1H2W1X7_9RHOB|nr:FAD-dependent monooxygenase [Roseicitreum antarcticum]SDW74662.1 2-polyprenyl-6-methoxyphenol hydroxylase [Roseicitreum antarcticum]